MVDFTSLKLVDGPPIYLQIVQFVKRGIAGGGIPHYDEMPSRRVLSALLGVNPNTIQKAYRTLEDEGLIVSQSGAKSYIQARTETVSRLRTELLGGDISTLVATFKAMGTTKEEAVALLNQLWEVEHNEE